MASSPPTQGQRPGVLTGRAPRCVRTADATGLRPAHVRDPPTSSRVAPRLSRPPRREHHEAARTSRRRIPRRGGSMAARSTRAAGDYDAAMTPAQYYSLMVGAVLLLVGILGFFVD